MNPQAHIQMLPLAPPLRVLACGAHLKNRACLVEGRRACWSALHGDLDDTPRRTQLAKSISHLLAAANGPLDAVAHDLHPDFPSTRIALELADHLGVPAVGIQHHAAHIGVAMAEQGLRQDVIGVALDGMGYGADGLAWGGEVLWVQGAARPWQRLAHLAPLAQPGGDRAAREPWRLAAAVLFATGRGAEILPRFGPQVGTEAAHMVLRMLQRGFNCPPSSSAGRWFDAAAGALGLCLRQTHEAEAAIALETLARTARVDGDVPSSSGGSGPETPPWALDLHPVVAALFALSAQGAAAQAQGALHFHRVLAESLAGSVIQAAAAHSTRQVVLAGGCFANRLLAEGLSTRLQQAGLHVCTPQAAGVGDEGLALGQAWLAAGQMAEQPVRFSPTHALED